MDKKLRQGTLCVQAGYKAKNGEPIELAIPLQGVSGLMGKHAIYLKFSSDTKEKSICKLTELVFTAD